LKLTDDQKTRIAKIRQHGEERREAIIKNEALNQDRKETILQRLNLIETSEIFRVLTPDQQKEVQKRIADRRASEQQEQHQSKHTASPATASPTPAAP
jgi:Spy/CpxP family protein refolding chaperone